jgi:hypothetical protein
MATDASWQSLAGHLDRSQLPVTPAATSGYFHSR